MTLEELNELGFTIEIIESNVIKVQSGFNYPDESLEQIMDNPYNYPGNNIDFYYDDSNVTFNLMELNGFDPILENCTYADIIEYVKNLG